MNFDLTDDQRLIQESAARFVAEYRDRQEMPNGFDSQLWEKMAEAGWISAGISPELGGFGGPIEAALIGEELGRGGIGHDFLGTAILGPQLFLAAEDEEARADFLDEIVSGTKIVAAAVSEASSRGNLEFVETNAVPDREHYSLTGTKTLVLGGDVADLFLVSALAGDAAGSREISLFLIEVREPGVEIVRTPLVDGSSAATVRFDHARARLLGRRGGGSAALYQMIDRGISWIAAEAYGMMAAVVEMTAEYARTRKQFGLPIAQFQVIQHKIADMAIDLEMARSVSHLALAGFEISNEVQRRKRFSGVKSAAGEALKRVTEAGVQIHGGMGMTVEYAVGRFLQRMVVLENILGTSTYHNSVYGRLVAKEELENT